MHSDQSASFFTERYLSERKIKFRYEIARQGAHNSKLSISVEGDNIISLYLKLKWFCFVLSVYLYISPVFCLIVEFTAFFHWVINSCVCVCGWASIGQIFSVRLTVVIDSSGWACVLIRKYCLVEVSTYCLRIPFCCCVWLLTREGTCAGSSLVKTEENNSLRVYLIGRSTEDLNTWIVNATAGAPETPKNL